MYGNKLKFTQRLIHCPDYQKANDMFEELNKQFGYDDQNYTQTGSGSYLKVIPREEAKKLYGDEYKDLREFAGDIEFSEYTMELHEHLVQNADKYKDWIVFMTKKDFFDLLTANNRCKDHVDGFLEKKWEKFNDEGFYTYEQDNCLELECYECSEDFMFPEGNGDPLQSGEEIQCPHCKALLELEIEYEPSYSTSKREMR